MSDARYVLVLRSPPPGHRNLQGRGFTDAPDDPAGPEPPAAAVHSTMKLPAMPSWAWPGMGHRYW